MTRPTHRKPAPFYRSRAIAAMLEFTYSLPFGERAAVLAKIPEYRSRGHGRGSPSRRYGNPDGKYMPHQGPRECERRRGSVAPLSPCSR